MKVLALDKISIDLDVRRGPLPKKAANRLKLALLSMVAFGVLLAIGLTLYRYGAHSWRFQSQYWTSKEETCSQTTSFAPPRHTSASTRVASIASAAQLDPGNYRLRVRLAQAYLSRGDCAHAKAEARAARALFPNAAEPRRVLAACGTKS